MQLQSLYLVNFKNYREVKLNVPSGINVLVGKNGSGKTNFLDAIHYLSLTKSAFSADAFSIRQGEQFFMIKGTINRSGTSTELLCSLQTGSKKVLREDAIEYQKLSDHIGKYPVVLIAPDDTQLVKEGSETRRKFFDSIISQLHHPYLEALIQYNYALKQRNGLLKIFAETNAFDEVALQSYDQLLIRTGELIYEGRTRFIAEFLPIFGHYYHYIVADEQAGLEYRSPLQDADFKTALKNTRQRDILLQRTNFGIHRDDYQFTLSHGDLKRLGSQGQQKSFILALKLAQFDILKQHKGFKPILLLDDIFDKLDDFRIGRLMELMQKDQFGQLFITDARPERTASLLKEKSLEATILYIENGEIVESKRF